jgi:hypothetical protein
MDNRFPNLLELSSLPGHPGRVKQLRAQIARICARTGARCLYNVVAKRLHFYRTDAAFGIPITGSDESGIPDALVRIREDGWLDEHRLVQIIASFFQRADMPKRDADAAIARAKAEAESAARSAHAKELEDRRPEAIAHLKRKGNRFGMGRHFRPVVTVDGFKERTSGLLVPQGG